MTATLLPNAKQQFLDTNGRPLAGGQVYFYIPNTSTFKSTWQNAGKTILNTNPVVLDSSGQAIIYGDGQYRQVVYDVHGNLIWDKLTDSYALNSEFQSFVTNIEGQNGSSLIGFSQSGTGAVQQTVQDSLREHVNSVQFGADPTGGTDSSTKFVNTYAAAQTHGTHFDVIDGTYLINNSSGFPDSSNAVQRVNIEMGPNVGFTGTIVPGNWFSIPCLGHSKGNGYNLITGSYEVSNPNMAFQDPGALGTYPFGHATRTLEVIPGTSFRGNADAIFAHAIGGSGGNYALGAINMVTRLESGFLGDGNGTEIDVDNYAADRKGLGAIITGIGSKICEAGVKVTRGDTTSPWYFGVRVERAKHGVYVDLSDEPSPIAAAYLTGMSQDLLQMRPKDDVNPTNAAAYLTNASGSVVKWRLNKNGSIDSSSYLKATGDVIVDTGNLGVMIGTASGALPTSAVACIAADAGGYGTFNDLIIQARTGAGTVGSIRFYGGGASPTEQWRIQTDNSFHPGTDNTLSLGSASNRASVVYAGTGTINTSDGREKQQIRDIEAAAIRAVRHIKFQQFKFNDAVKLKGDGARWHFGVIAQQVKEAFEAEGLDPFAYGLLCYDEWEAKPEIVNDDGSVAQPARPAGNRYGVRYDELWALKIASLESPPDDSQPTTQP